MLRPAGIFIGGKSTWTSGKRPVDNSREGVDVSNEGFWIGGLWDQRLARDSEIATHRGLYLLSQCGPAGHKPAKRRPGFQIPDERAIHSAPRRGSRLYYD